MYLMMVNPTSLLDLDTSLSMTTDLDGSGTDIALFTTEPDLTPLAESAIGLGTPLLSDTSALTLVIVDVPELNWMNPGAPTIKAPKVKEKNLGVIHYNFFFIRFVWVPDNSTYWDEFNQSSPPAAPDDDIPPMQQYEAPESTFNIYCRKKGKVPDMDLFTLCHIMAIQFLVLAYMLQDMTGSLPPFWVLSYVLQEMVVVG
ncbi:hypothetical protein DAEQUDRAFT_768045 [Daedalea quercina L-15889]|uniref:Uncharacterized protein n=1 Tax=Daedalea quercina L-15889 TaxID=1314783 RepID=A0A165N069_9APHY|nr:hypothetical protein DAEQUDRAFT_768045 [Daedalea quercina L-15889]